MSYRKFGKNDFFTNTMKAYPKVSFYIKSAEVYYNNVPRQEGVRNKTGTVRVPQDYTGSVSDSTITAANTNLRQTVRNINKGHISLYEYNIDRPIIATNRIVGSFPEAMGTGSHPTSSLFYLKRKSQYNAVDKPIDFVEDKGIIYPFITKDGAGAVWKTVSNTAYMTAFKYGDVLTASYPLSASVSREYITKPYHGTASADHNAHYTALRNRLNFYGARSPAYLVESPYGNKDTLDKMNLISIPSIFYGTRINPGSISLKFFITGTLVGELRDTRNNGELIQVGPTGSTGSGSVAGVALYDEGFLMLTASWALTPATYGFTTSGKDSAKWVYFGAGMHDGLNASNTEAGFTSASYAMDFKGTTETQVMTMFAHANRGEANYSNNPTFIEKGQTRNEYTSSYIFEQKDDIRIKNIVSSSYSDYSAPFKRQLYISKIGVYDRHKNLIGLATLSNPILKEDKDSISFKIKLDI